jgi:hypothetical protein
MSTVSGHWPGLPLPATFDQAMTALRIVVDRVKGASTDNAEAAYAANILVGFGISQIAHDHPVIFGAEPVTIESLEAMLSDDGLMRSAAPDAKAGQWVSILLFVMPLAVKWLEEMLRRKK